MADRVYQQIELTGCSTAGIEDTVRKAIPMTSARMISLRRLKVGGISWRLQLGRVGH